MEKLLHYAWRQRLYSPLVPHTDDGTEIEVIDPGLPNRNAGPDFFNAKIKVGGDLIVGNVEIHVKASDWMRHRHHEDPAYDNVILHVVRESDTAVRTSDGRIVPQVAISLPPDLCANYEQLLRESTYPPCHRIMATVPKLVAHSWLSALTAERLEAKTQRIYHYLERTGGDWERTFFVALARNFGFGVNSDAFEEWAFTILPQQVGKHRDNLFQVEAFFFGQAGLLAPDAVAPERQDDYFRQLQKEYAFLKNKFSLQPQPATTWRFLRLRPQNFPTVRLSQLARLYHSGNLTFSRLLDAPDAAAFRQLLATQATDYWKTHYTFGHESTPAVKQIRTSSLNLVCINTIAPLLFAYGRHHANRDLCDRAIELLEALPSEHNYITRTWHELGLDAEHAADSQALIHLKTRYCDRKDCLRCAFGTRYLKHANHSDQP
ncbi:MAG: DUF2851 family protein [Alloprevotella sp.]|nr:DUF2851 family protein [Alloprevotella sp.]